MSKRPFITRMATAQEGFTMIVAMGVLLVTSLLVAAVFTTVQGDARTTGADLDGKRAYAAAQAGVQAYLYLLNANSTTNWWENCSNDTSGTVQVSGAPSGVTYSYAPANACVQGSPDSLIDSSGNLRLEFKGVSGSATRIIVAGFRTNTPLSYLWYTVHETLDPAADPTDCSTEPFYAVSTPNSPCQIAWTTGDVVNGPLYTQDELNISPGTSPSFQSAVTSSPSLCVNGCQSATFPQGQTAGAPLVPLPATNINLYNDAVANGIVITGAATIYLNGSNPASTTIYSCTTSSSCSSQTVDLTKKQIIYASSASSGCNTAYSPKAIGPLPTTTYAGTTVYYGACGDIYVKGTYSTPLTLASANDIILVGSLTQTSDSNGTTMPTGAATLGLIASQYVRVAHPATIGNNGLCTAGTASNPNVTIDAAILTLAHSFFVDNYNCGNSTTGTLTVHGAIAQYYRGAVAVAGQNGAILGYAKNYNYDARLADILPPYMIDLQSTNWSVLRETLCSQAVGTC